MKNTCYTNCGASFCNVCETMELFECASVVPVPHRLAGAYDENFYILNLGPGACACYRPPECTERDADAGIGPLSRLVENLKGNLDATLRLPEWFERLEIVGLDMSNWRWEWIAAGKYFIEVKNIVLVDEQCEPSRRIECKIELSDEEQKCDCYVCGRKLPAETWMFSIELIQLSCTGTTLGTILSITCPLDDLEKIVPDFYKRAIAHISELNLLTVESRTAFSKQMATVARK
jgi:hypothetical protein